LSRFFLLKNVLILQDEGYQEVSILVNDGVIQAIQPVAASQVEPTPDLPIVDGQHKLLLPGFVNGHTHSSQMWQRGLIEPLPLELWLANLIDSSPQELEQIYWGALSTAVETLKSGGTCLTDHLTLLPGRELESVAAVVRAYRQVGIRALIAPLVQDQPLGAGLPGRLPTPPQTQTAAEVLQLIETIVQEFHDPASGISIGVGPTGFHRCSDALLTGSAELSQRYGLCRHTHLLETRMQHKLAQEKYGGSAVQHLHKLGFLNNQTSLAHCVWLEPADLPLLAETGATVVHNPVSNLRLGSGIAPILDCLAAGVNVAFGCDGAASNDGQDLLEAIKLGTMLHNITDPDYRHWITPRRAIQLAVSGGAQGVGLADQIGKLAVGYSADFVLYNLPQSLLAQTDLIQFLVYAKPAQTVERVWVKGQLLVEAGNVLTVEPEQVTQLFPKRDQAHRFQFDTIRSLESHYRKVALPESEDL
jgi:5-methylthioadenosine/S-adenosylhomocysteine deaminase